MGILEFLNTLEATMETIEVKGKDNLSALYSCMLAIDDYRKTVISMMKQEAVKVEDGGDEVGRQSDIGTDSGNDNSDI